MFLTALCIGVIFLAAFASHAHPGFANAQQNKTLMQPQVVLSTKTTANTTKMNIILVHGAWADASSWSKVFLFCRRQDIVLSLYSFQLVGSSFQHGVKYLRMTT